MLSKDQVINLIKKVKPNCKDNSCNAYSTSFLKLQKKYEEK